MITVERFEAKIASSLKEEIRHASTLTGSTMTDFVISAAVERAREVIEQQKKWKLDEEQSRDFVAHLLSDREPGPRLREAAERYKQSELAR